jgi:flagellar biosynthesis GTPase FlhF
MTHILVRPQPRAGLELQKKGDALCILDSESQQQWVLSADETLVWQALSAHEAADTVNWVQSLCAKHPLQLTATRVWAALDALADRGLLQGRAAPPAAETVTNHQQLNQRLSRRQWAVAGLAMAAAPGAFAASVAAAEEKVKADVQAAPPADVASDDPRAQRRQEQETKLQKRAMQEENQKSQRSAEQQKKVDAKQEQAQARAQEQQQKQAKRQQEEQHKLSSRSQEQARKRDNKDKASDEAPKPF